MFFHGSEHKINNFTDDFVGGREAHDQEGPGIYFTSSSKNARSYGPYVYTVMLNPKKLVSTQDGKSASIKEIEWLIKQAPNWEMYAENFNENPNLGVKIAAKNILQYNENPHQQFLQVWVDFYRDSPVDYVRGMTKLGYDAIKIEGLESMISGEVNITHIIVLNPAIIKFVEMEDDRTEEEKSIQEIRKFVRKTLNENIVREEYPTQFNMDKFKSLKTFKERIEYCEANLKRIGGGSSRIVYKIDDQKVLKLAKNKKGIVQNETEIDRGTHDYFSSILAQVFDSDEGGLWVEMELATPINKHEFRMLTTFELTDVGNYLINFQSDNSGRGKPRHQQQPLVDRLDNDEFIQSLREFVAGTDALAGDLGKASSYGLVNRNGTKELVIVDFGLTDTDFEKLYRESKETGSNINDNFWKWFAGSKIVDADGNPLLVHHGTSKKFSKFNLKNAPQKIVWFTSNKSAIEAGEVGAAGKGHIMDLYVSMKNPAGWNEYEKYGLGQLKELGYDGAILPDPDGTFTGFVFEPTQLKSVKNKGEWNPSDKSIYKEEDNAEINKYVYHGTSKGAAYRMQREGSMKPGQASGSPKAPLSFSNTEQYASTYASRKDSSGGVLLRIKITPDIKVNDRISNSGGYVEYYTFREIPIGEIEIKTENGWVSFEQYDFINENLKEEEGRELGKSLADQTNNPYVIIYRAAPITANEFLDRDYVTLSKKFAIEHAESNHVYHEEPYHVIQALVSTKDVYDAYNPGEYFYSGPNKKAKKFYVSKGPGEYEGLDEGANKQGEYGKPYKFYMLCDKLCNLEGVEVKNKMIADATPVSRKEFVKNCAYAEELFKYESNMLDDPSHGFYRSNVKGVPCYYMQYVGFEFIFIKDYPTGKEYWLDEMLDENRYEKGNEKYANCLMSDLARMDIIESFLKKVEEDPNYNTEEPDYDMLLDPYDGYDDQIYIQNDLKNDKIIFREGWSSLCWKGLYAKPEYKGLSKEASIKKIFRERIPRIAQEFNMSIESADYFFHVTSDEMVDDGFIMKIVLKNNDLKEIRNGKPEVKTIYHGTSLKNVDKIKVQGLQTGSMGYNSAGWYMVSTDFASALFHGVAMEDNDAVPVIEFEVPVDNAKWEGYPYFWPPFERNNDSKWFALKEPIPANLIKKVHYVSYADFAKQKERKF